MSAEQPKFRVSILPEAAGKPEDILARVPIGQQRWKKEMGLRQQKRESARKGFQELGEDPAKTEYYLNNLYPVSPMEYHLDLTSAISSDEILHRAFTPAITVMHRLAGENGITLPEDLSSRLFVVDQETFDWVHFQELGIIPEGAEAYTLPNRLCFLSTSNIKRESRRLKVGMEDMLLKSGVHELWHSSEYQEDWIPSDSGETPYEDGDGGEPKRLFRRCGMKTKGLGADSDITIGLLCLNEGFTQYLTKETIKLIRKKPLPERDNRATVVEELVQRIGIRPFFQAAYTKLGFRQLAVALEDEYGYSALYRDIDRWYEEGTFWWNAEQSKKYEKKIGREAMLGILKPKKTYPLHALRHIATLLGEEERISEVAEMEGEEPSIYPVTMRFIQREPKSKEKGVKRLFKWRPHGQYVRRTWIGVK